MNADGFRPAWWLPGPHLQTLWGRVAREAQRVSLRREILETPDGDELILDHLQPEGGSGAHVLLLHGLEGSSFSPYLQGLMAQIARRGWRATALNFRSCARDPGDPSRMIPNRRPRLYHSGETTDFDFVARTLASRDPSTPLAAIGVSLGGNALLKWLGEHPAQSPLAAAATISVPYDLAAGARHLESRLGRLYVSAFLTTLRPKAIRTARRFPEAAERIDVERVRRSRTFWEFDDAATGPLHGFRGADDYYARSSSIGFVARIATPTLCLSSEDDPFLPAAELSRMQAAASPAVELVVTRSGGHVGFVAGAVPWKLQFWAEDMAIGWLANAIAAHSHRASGSGF